MQRFAILTILLALSMSAHAKLYKWVDADGNVTYSERKPADASAEEIKLRGVSSVSQDQARERLENISGKADTIQKDREFKQNVTSESAERDARLAENCETARQNKRVLEAAPRVQTDDGTFLDEKARAARIAQTEQDIKNSCSD